MNVTAKECTYTPSRTLTKTMAPPLPPPSCGSAVTAAREAELPLFNELSTTASGAVAGFTLVLPTRTPLNASVSLLLHNNLTTGLAGLTFRVVSTSVAGNPDGFAAHVPSVVVTVLNTTSVRVELQPTPGYSIDEMEYLDVYIGAAGVVGPECTVGLQSRREALKAPPPPPSSGGGYFPAWPATDFASEPSFFVGRIVMNPNDKGPSDSAVTSTVVSGGAAAAAAAGAGSAGMAAEQQGLSAVAMSTCADGKTKSSFGAYRALSPFAIFESYAGVVLGNVIAYAVVLLVQLTALAVLKLRRPSSWLLQNMATGRFPSVLISVVVSLHTGTGFAASQLVSMPDKYEAWEVAVGAVAFGLFVVVFPVFTVLHPYLRVERAYQEYLNEEWIDSKPLPWLIRYTMPQGTLFSAETRRAYGGYVSAYKAPASQVWWTSFGVWTSFVVAVGGLVHPESKLGCKVLFIVEGVIFVAMAVVVVWRNPLRATAASHFNALAKVLMGVILFCMAVSIDGVPPAVDAVVSLGWIQTMFTIVRVIHSFVSQMFDRKMASDDFSLRTVWSHVPASSANTKKLTQVFGVGVGSADDLRAAAASRDAVDADRSSNGMLSMERSNSSDGSDGNAPLVGGAIMQRESTSSSNSYGAINSRQNSEEEVRIADIEL